MLLSYIIIVLRQYLRQTPKNKNDTKLISYSLVYFRKSEQEVSWEETSVENKGGGAIIIVISSSLAIVVAIAFCLIGARRKHNDSAWYWRGETVMVNIRGGGEGKSSADA